jgi:hypothetical protein
MGNIREFKYKLIKNFLSKEELEIGSYYFNLKHKKNITSFDTIQNNNGDSKFDGDAFSETILMRKLKKMEEESGLKLFPTYSFSRVYTYNALLEKHKDRPSCEISVTVMWESDGTKWPIFIENTPVAMEPGDAVMYLGCELEHWRENFKGDYHIQTFLHYVDQNGLYKDYKYDKRDFQFSPEI